MATLPEPARYFPVTPRPYRMEAKLVPLGTDFGNGERDRQFFQLDRERERYLRTRRAIPSPCEAVLCGDEARRRCHARVVDWMIETLAREHPHLAAPRERSYAALYELIQEDFAVMYRPADGADRALGVYVSFPSGWRPERIAGRSFAAIHRPVPNFADSAATNASMLASMIERGPYVRFVWTICADHNLDHHPERGTRAAWRPRGPGWLRVERQVTVPFAEESASLFLIRTYLYPFSSLRRARRTTLAAALDSMPQDVARYKGLTDEVRAIARGILAGGEGSET